MSVVSRYKASWCLSVGVTATCYIVTGIWWAWWAVTRRPDVSQWGWQLHVTLLQVSDERGEPLQGVLMSLSGGDSYMLHCYRYLMSVVSRYKASWCLSVGVTATCYIVTGIWWAWWAVTRRPDVSQWGWQLHVTLLQVSDERGEPLQGVLMSLSGGDSYMLHCYRYLMSVVSRYKESWCLSVGVTATCYIVTGIWWAWWAVTSSPDVSQWGWQLHVTLLQVSDERGEPLQGVMMSLSGGDSYMLHCYRYLMSVVSRYKESWCLSVGVTATCYIVTGIWRAWWAVTGSPDVSQWGWQLHVTLLQVSDERGEPLQGVLMSLSGGDSYMLHCYRYLMSVVSRYKESWCLSVRVTATCYIVTGIWRAWWAVTGSPDVSQWGWQLHVTLLQVSDERGEPLQGVLMSLSGGDSYMLHCYRYLMSVVSRYKESWCLSVGVTATCYIVTGIWRAWWAVTGSPDVSQWGWQLHVTLLQVSDERGEPLQGVLMSLSGGDSYMLHCYRYLMSVVSRYRESWCLSVGVTATCYIVTGIWRAWWAVTGSPDVSQWGWQLHVTLLQVSDERGEPLQGVLMSLSGGDSYMLHCYRYLTSVVSHYKASWCLSVGVTVTCYMLQISDERGEPLQGVLMSLSGGDSYMLHCYRYLMSVVSRYKASWCLSVGVTATCYIVTGIWWAWWAVTRRPDVSQWGWQLHVTLLQVSDERGEPLQGVLMSLSGGDSYMLHCYRYLMSVVSRYKTSWCRSVGVTATCYIVTGIWWAWWAVTRSPDVSQWGWQLHVTLLQVSDERGEPLQGVLMSLSGATCYIVTGIWWAWWAVTRHPDVSQWSYVLHCYIVTGIWWAWWAVTRGPDVSQWGWQLHVTLVQVSDERGEPLQGVLMSLSGGDSYMLHCYRYLMSVVSRYKESWCLSVGVTATCYIVTLLQVSDERGEPLQGVLMSLSGGDSYMLHCYRYLMSVVSRYKESWCLSVGVTATCYIVTGIWWAWWAVTRSPDVSQWGWQLHVTLLQVSDERGEPLQGVLMSLSGGDSYMLHCYRYLMSVVSRYKESWCLSVGVTATCYIVTGIWWAWWAVTRSPDVSQWGWQLHVTLFVQVSDKRGEPLQCACSLLCSVPGDTQYMLGPVTCIDRYLMSVVSRYRWSPDVSQWGWKTKRRNGLTTSSKPGIWWAWWAVTDSVLMSLSGGDSYMLHCYRYLMSVVSRYRRSPDVSQWGWQLHVTLLQVSDERGEPLQGVLMSLSGGDRIRTC